MCYFSTFGRQAGRGKKMENVYRSFISAVGYINTRDPTMLCLYYFMVFSPLSRTTSAFSNVIYLSMSDARSLRVYFICIFVFFFFI